MTTIVLRTCDLEFSYHTGKVPSSWKIAFQRFSSHTQKGDLTDPFNYWAIAIISALQGNGARGEQPAPRQPRALLSH